MGRLMYTPHPPESRLSAFVPPSLVSAAENDVRVVFDELLEMRRVIEQIATDLKNSKPDLVPFFATGGIPFMFPSMHALAARRELDLLGGRHFHMFPGLSWSGKLDGIDSESYFVREFGKLIVEATRDDRIRIWTMDATFTGNAIRKLLKALHRTFYELTKRPKRATVFLLAIIDASRADRNDTGDKIPLDSPVGRLFLKLPADYSPVGVLRDRQPLRFIRNDGDDLFDLTVEFRVVSAIPTEDRAELIGAIAKKDTLGVESEHQVGRLTVEFANGYSPSGTGGNGIGSNVLNYLSNTEDKLPWRQWLITAALPPLGESDRKDYEESRFETQGALRIYELMGANTDVVIEGLLSQKRLLDGVEVYCLKEHALRQLEESGEGNPICIPTKLLRKVLASAKKDSDSVSDALMIFRLSRLDRVSEEPAQSECELLDWWDAELSRDSADRSRKP